MKTPYSHKYEIVEFLENFLQKHKNESDYSSDFHLVTEKMTNAQTFRIPDYNTLPTIKDYLSFYEFMKPPYERFFIEMPFEDKWLVYYVADMREEKGIIACMIFEKTEKGEWLSFGDVCIDMDETGYELTRLIDDVGIEENKRFAWTVFEFMVAVNTPNIKQTEIKAPKLINEKRKKKGKKPLEGYHYLDLRPHEITDSESTGTGATKRMHWRRGHIRRLTDKTVWVRPALIGSEGFIDKTYRLQKRPTA